MSRPLQSRKRANLARRQADPSPSRRSWRETSSALCLAWQDVPESWIGRVSLNSRTYPFGLNELLGRTL